MANVELFRACRIECSDVGGQPVLFRRPRYVLVSRRLEELVLVRLVEKVGLPRPKLIYRIR